ATGAYLAARFARAGIGVTLAARGTSARQISREGITIVDGDGRWRATPTDVIDTSGPSMAGSGTGMAGSGAGVAGRGAGVAGRGASGAPLDVVLVCVKTYDTDVVLPIIDRLREPGTAVLSLQNGVRCDDALARHFGPENVLSGVLYIGAHRNGPGEVECTSPPRIFVGPYAGGGASGGGAGGGAGDAAGDLARGAAERFVTLCHEAGIEAVRDEAILTAKWQKFLFNCGLNPLTALTGKRLGSILADAATRQIFVDLVSEATAAGRAAGAPLAEDAYAQAMATAERMDISSSMAEDLAAGRPLELDAFSGHVLELAQRYGCQAPVTRSIDGLLRVAVG